ncbi:kinase-like protein [Marasmius fiardii PR-910]|nr:kinase-like protein [Marasmius fiardii PR-910]
MVSFKFRVLKLGPRDPETEDRRPRLAVPAGWVRKNSLLRFTRTYNIISSRFIPSRLDGIENIEDYKPGGYHPVSIGDTFDMGRFRVLHKLGFGGSSTVWLARDQQQGGKIVTLKALRADVSSKAPSEIPELAISQKLRAILTSSDSVNFQTVYHHFSVQGPNGSHLFLVSALAGPSVLAMSDSPGRVSDLTTSNILFRLSPHVTEWSDDEVYAHLGEPETEDVMTREGKPPGPHAPAILVEPIQNSKISDASLLQENTIVSDFGQSYLIASPPPSYEPATVLNYLSPEVRFERRAGLESDIWALGLAIFEIRAGFALFEPFLGSDADILKQTVETLGRLPDPWWGAFKEHTLWFEEDGQPKSERDQERANVLLKAYRSSIGDKLHEIGKQYDPPSEYEGPMVEEFGVLLPEEEIELLEDLLEKMLRYSPEERIAIEDVIRHPWFAF